MDRKVSQFAIGEHFTTRESIERWATGEIKGPVQYEVKEIYEKSEGFVYRTRPVDGCAHLIYEPDAIPLGSAKGEAVQWLSGRLAAIADS